MTRALMIQGTGSNTGKSMVVAGLCRALRLRGLSVAPFKPQNMSNNAAVTLDGGEIGRAQAVQALAAGRDPVADMNPVLLKPEAETGAQLIVQGRVAGKALASEYWHSRGALIAPVMESFRRLAQGADIVMVEGAGSPAEINLRTGDIANMGFAEAAGVPVILLGDIDRGGVIAQIVGTHAVLPPADRAHIAGFAVNKFRGDPTLFEDGYAAIAAATGWPGMGVIPWFSDAWRLPAEDAVDLTARPGSPVRIAVPQLRGIANFDDLDPLTAEPGVTVEIVPPGRALPGDATLVLLPGSKTTLADLAQMRTEGWDIDLAAHRRRGGHILGLCGGYQMLGREIRDPLGVEGPPGAAEGLGLLDITTELRPEKRLARVDGRALESGAAVSGYEIHMGVTDGPDRARAWLEIGGAPEGAASPDGRVRGSYLHGLFAEDGFRAGFLAELGAAPSGLDYRADVDRTLDALAAHLETHLDIDRMLTLAGPAG